uniref:Uncharacterized protein n=1 Tax=viral metagenome TaxID=1070528 RepID=A0A6M3LME0_9ZZZZ
MDLFNAFRHQNNPEEKRKQHLEIVELFDEEYKRQKQQGKKETELGTYEEWLESKLYDSIEALNYILVERGELGSYLPMAPMMPA